MNDFVTNTIEDGKEYIASKLRAKRNELGLNLKEAADKLNINYKYIEALEKGEFSFLPKGLYGRNYLKEYALFLGLDANQLTKIYEEEHISGQPKTQPNPFSHKKPRAIFFLSLPKIIRNIIIIIIVFICLSYLAYYLNNIISPPELAIYYPETDITVEKNIITVQGRTEAEAKLLINGEIILTDSDGFFTQEIKLKKGLNNIQISSQKKYSRQNIISKKVIWAEENME